MKRIIYFMCCILNISCVTASEKQIPCWASDDTTKVITSQEAILKTYLLPFDFSDPEGDAKIRISHGDYRLLGIGGFGLEYPPLDKFKDGHILCEFGGRYIQGTSDAYENESHAQLISRFVEYAESYNLVIINYYKHRILPK